MPVIKADKTPAAIIPFSMNDIEVFARQIVHKARNQADELLAAAQQEAEALKKSAQAQGLLDGKKEGLAKGLEEGKKAGHQQALNEAKAQLAAVVKTLSTATTQLNDSRRKLDTEGINEVIKLSFAIARRVTKRQGLLDIEVLKSNIVEAMKLVVHSTDVRVAVHPSQMKTIQTELPKLQLSFPALEHVEFIEDPKLTPGGCKIFTRNGLIDADLNDQLDRVIEELLPTTVDLHEHAP